MKASVIQVAYMVATIGAHNRGMHDQEKHPACRLCHPEEAALLDQLRDEDEISDSTQG